jgi:hypothetical protein
MIDMVDYINTDKQITWSYDPLEDISINIEDNIMVIRGLNGQTGEFVTTIEGCIQTDCASKELNIEIIDDSRFEFNIPESDRYVIFNMNQIYDILMLSDYTDNDGITFSSLPTENLSITIAEDTKVTFTPDTDWSGSREVVFQACDDLLCKNQTITVEVV